MESLDSEVKKDDNFFSATEVRSYLLEAARWGKFLAIVGYVVVGLILLAAIAIMGIGSSFSNLIPGMSGAVFGIFYIAFAALYFFPVYYLHQFSVKIKQGLNSQSQTDVTLGFQNLKSLFKFMGIFTIIILSIYGVFFLFAIIMGVATKL